MKKSGFRMDSSLPPTTPSRMACRVSHSPPWKRIQAPLTRVSLKKQRPSLAVPPSSWPVESWSGRCACSPPGSSLALGTAGFGLYAFATATVASIVGAIAPLGMDAGLIMYGARYRSGDEQSRLKVLLTGLGTVAVSGPLFAVAVWLLVRSELIWVTGPRKVRRSLTISAGIVLVAVFAVLLGALLSAEDMVSQTLSQLIALPVFSSSGPWWPSGLALRVDGVIMAFIVAHGVAVVMAARRVWARDGRLRRTRPYAHSLSCCPHSLATPFLQSFARVLYRANLWVDILMLTALAALADVGVYRVSVALAMMGALPVVASTTMFGPVIAVGLQRPARQAECAPQDRHSMAAGGRNAALFWRAAPTGRRAGHLR